MLQGYSGKHWVQIPRKQAVFVHSWYSQSSPWEWREDEVYYVQRGCCRYVQSFIIMFFFLTSRSSPRVFFREKDIRLFSVFAFLPLKKTEDVISPSSSELTLHPSTFTSTTFNLFVILRAWLSTLNAVDFLFLQLWAKWEKSKIKLGLWKSLKWDFEKKKRELLFFRCFSFWQETRDLLLQTDESLQEHRAVVFLHFYYYCWKCSVLYFSIRPWQITKAQNFYYNNCRLLDFALISSPRFLNFYFSKNVETKMKKGKAGTSCRNLPFSE